MGIEFGVYAAHYSTCDCSTVHKFFPVFKNEKNE